MRAFLVDEKLGPLSIWNHVEQGRQYVIGIDVAEGKVRDMASARKRDLIAAVGADRPDYSCAIVLDMETAQHVASWHGYMAPGDFAMCCVALGWYYNAALLTPETNGPGIVLVDVFRKIQYPNIYRAKKLVNRIVTDPLQPELGWTTSAISRPLLIDGIREVLVANPGFTTDKGLIDELRTMEIEPSRGEARARGKNKDDRVLALGIALQARIQYLSGATDSDLDPMEHLEPAERKVWEQHDRRRARGTSMDPGSGVPGLGRRYGAEPDGGRKGISSLRDYFGDHLVGRGPKHWDGGSGL